VRQGWFSAWAWIAGMLLLAGAALAAPGPLSISFSLPSALHLHWPTIPGRQYHLEESADLSTWRPGSPFTATTLEATRTLTTGSGITPRYFRIAETRTAPEWQTAFFCLPGPNGTEPDFTLENKVTELLDNADPGSTVRVSIYLWDREEMIAPFAAAAGRGVDVRIICGSDSPAIDGLLAALPGRVLVCRNEQGEPVGCNGGPINHNKFYLFSALGDGSRDTVVQSSANLCNHQLLHANNMVVLRNETALFQAYQQYWTDLSAHLGNLNYYRTAVSPGGAEAGFFPRGFASGGTGALDPVVQVLRDVNPAMGGSIHVAMAFWTSPRRAIADWLVSINRGGCPVTVLVDSEDTTAPIVNILATGGITLRRFPQLHSKYMLIDATWRGTRQKLVLTGSHNYTGPALMQNDETLLRLQNPEIYDAFLADWERIRSHPLTAN
jgi:PLD-like domain